jgi:hypothetical protein
MAEIPRENGTEAGGPIHPDNSPALLLRNEDDAEHALDVCIADDDAVLAEGCHTVAGESQHAVGATETDGDTLRVDLRADNGGTASLTVDLGRSLVPEFVVRRDTIVVAGLH